MGNATFRLQDSLEKVQNERTRLTGIVNSPEFKNNLRNWGWMIDWLKKSDEEHLKTFYGTNCCFCGKGAMWLVDIDPSCDEYDCSIRICKKCLFGMSKLFSKIKT